MYPLAFAFAFIVTIAIMPVVVKAMQRWQVIDKPNHRSSHAVVTPRGGGVGPAIAATLTIALFGELTGGMTLAIAMVVAIGALGFADDIWSLPFTIRLAAQIALALVAVLGIGLAGQYWLLFVLPIVIAAVINAFNFMDGINGISGSTMAVAGLYYALIGSWADLVPLTVIGMALLGAGLGFLPFNLPTAKIFLGDVGSYYAGALLGVAAVVAYQIAGVSPVEALAPLVIYATDTCFTIVKRLKRGDHWHEPHREHVYQRITTGERGHHVSTVIVSLFNLSTAGIALASLHLDWPGVVPPALMAVAAGCYLLLPKVLGTET